MKIFTAGMPELCQSLISSLKDDVIIEHNFQQIVGMAKLGELDKLCIFMDVWNFYGRQDNQVRGQGAAEAIHLINPDISIVIIDGREFEPYLDYIDLPPAFQVQGTGDIHPIKNKNELYLSFDHYSRDVIKQLVEKFFEGTLTSEDIVYREFVDFKFND